MQKERSDRSPLVLRESLFRTRVIIKQLQNCRVDAAAFPIHAFPRNVILKNIRLIHDFRPNQLLNHVLKRHHAHRFIKRIARRVVHESLHKRHVSSPRSKPVEHKSKRRILKHLEKIASEERQQRPHGHFVIRVNEDQVLCENHALHLPAFSMVHRQSRMPALEDRFHRIKVKNLIQLQHKHARKRRHHLHHFLLPKLQRATKNPRLIAGKLLNTTAMATSTPGRSGVLHVHRGLV
mmetsp:Transcript_10170/g.21311  ORF Transcript_10170/g.21311 Transcript_10170/m.21311 type:complete len:236 (-) Transcript_10170:760-1467(-)